HHRPFQRSPGERWLPFPSTVGPVVAVIIPGAKMTTITDVLRAHAEAADRLADWPSASWEVLRTEGVLGWSVPPEFGGSGLGPVELLTGIEAIAAGCLTTAFILNQREAAVRWLLKGPALLQERYLPGTAKGEHFLTVGLSQLTTSRQHQGP